MNKDFSKTFKKTSAGNYFGYYNGYYVFATKRPHGGYYCRIGKNGEWIYREGFFTSYLKNVAKLKEWVKDKIVYSVYIPN